MDHQQLICHWGTQEQTSPSEESYALLKNLLSLLAMSPCVVINNQQKQQKPVKRSLKLVGSVYLGSD